MTPEDPRHPLSAEGTENEASTTFRACVYKVVFFQVFSKVNIIFFKFLENAMVTTAAEYEARTIELLMGKDTPDAGFRMCDIRKRLYTLLAIEKRAKNRCKAKDFGNGSCIACGWTHQ